MKMKPGKIIVYFLTIVSSVSRNVVSAASTDHVHERTKRNTAQDHPIVYTMDVPFATARDSTVAEFVTEIDLLSTTTVRDGAFVRLSFLVHTRDEYDRILPLAPFAVVEDTKETAALNGYVASLNVGTQGSAGTIPGFPCYRDLRGMIALLADLESRAETVRDLTVEVTDIGDSYEKTLNPNQGYDMLALKITGDGVSSRGHSTSKGIVFITCGVHAREYAPPELCARWAELLVDNYGTDAETTAVLDHTEVHMIIESNPDGRAIAEANRAVYHRKNTRPGCTNFDSRGVDLNRNWPFLWGGLGASSSTCSTTYRGSGPASEPEVKAIIEYAEGVFPESQRKDDPVRDVDEPYPEDSTVGVFYDIHAYGNLIIWPYIYQERLSPNEESLQAAARKMTSFNNYRLAGPNQPGWLYAASGNTADYFYGELGALSFAYELGTGFYQDCNTFQNTILPDNIPGFMYTAKISTRPYILSKGPDVTKFLVPNTVNYPNDLEITVEVSDSSLSSGNHPPSTQDIAFINLCADLHPYDTDPSGNGPRTLSVAAGPNAGTTITREISIPLSTADLFRDPLEGPHVLYAWGTDVDGTVGPVEAVEFRIACGRGGCDPDPPTDSPVRTPTDSPVRIPTDSPVRTLTDSPVRIPTDSPVRTTTDSPVRTPTDAPVTDSPTTRSCKGTTEEDSCEALGCHWYPKRDKCKKCDTAKKKKKCTQGGCVWGDDDGCFSCIGAKNRKKCVGNGCAWINGSCLSCRAGDPEEDECVKTNGCAWKRNKCISCRELKKSSCVNKGCVWNKGGKVCDSAASFVSVVS